MGIMDEDALLAARAKFGTIRSQMKANLMEERKADAKAKGIEFVEDKVEHKHNVDDETMRAIKKRKKQRNANLLDKMENEKAAVHKKTGVTSKTGFMKSLEEQLIKCLKEKREEIIEFSWVEALKSFKITLRHLKMFWKDID